MRGLWYLTYQEFDRMENEIGSAILNGQTKVVIPAQTEEEALRAAHQLWNERLSKGSYAGWDNSIYPRNPKLIYEILL